MIKPRKQIIALFGCAVMLLAAPCGRKTAFDPGSRVISPLSIEVIYDESHDNVWGLRDTGFYGYSAFAAALMNRGLAVSRNSLPLDALIGRIKSKEIPHKALVLNVAKFRRYLREEVLAVERFVRAGGALLVIGEHENMYGSSDMQNDMLRPFGMELADDFAGDVIPRERMETAATAILNQKAFSDKLDCPDVRHLLSAPVKAGTGAAGFEVLLQGFRDGRKVTIAGGIPWGRGRAAVLGDSELFWNGDGSTGIGTGGNLTFLVRLFEWLLGGRLPARQAGKENIPGETNGRVRVFIDTSSHGRGVDDSTEGLRPFAGYLEGRGFALCAGHSCSRYDVQIVADPLSAVPYAGDTEKRMILIAGSRQDLVPGSEWGRLLLKMGARNPDSVYARIETAAQFTMQPCFLTDGGVGKNYFDIEFVYKDARRLLHRAGSIDVRGSGLKEWLVPGNSVWGETKHPGVENRNQGIPVFDNADVRRPVLGAYNARLLVIASGDLILPGRGDDRFFRSICDGIVSWIRTGEAK